MRKILSVMAVAAMVACINPAQASEAKKGAEVAKAQFFELSPLVLPVVDEKGISQVVSLVISIQVKDQGKLEKVTQQQPRLQDAYIQGMYGMLNKNAALKDGVLQVGMIKDRLNTISKKVMGDGVVDDVLLQVVQQHRI